MFKKMVIGLAVVALVAFLIVGFFVHPAASCKKNCSSSTGQSAYFWWFLPNPGPIFSSGSGSDEEPHVSPGSNGVHEPAEEPVEPHITIDEP